MKFPNFNQIKWKLTFVALIPTTLVLCMAGIAIFIYDQMNWRRNLVHQIGTMAEMVGANSSAALAFKDERDARETLNSLRVHPEIDLACLELPNGQPFVSITNNGISLEPLSKLPRIDSQTFTHDHLFVVRRIISDKDFAGFIVVGINLEQEKARSRAFVIIAGLSLLGLIAMAMLVATRLQRLVSDPLGQLIAASQQITLERDYSVRVENESRDEVGTLMAAFNQMLAEIERQNQKLSASESRLKLSLAASKMGVWEWNVQKNTVVWATDCNRLFGEPVHTTTIAEFYELVHPDDVVRLMSEFHKVVAEKTSFAIEYRVNSDGKDMVWVSHHGELRCDPSGTPCMLIGLVQDVSNRKHAEADHQELIARLFNAENEERRRIARELHDTTAQHLAALKLALTRVQVEANSENAATLHEGRDLLNQALQEIRTLTYILHPPVLEEFGLVRACKDLATGLTQRSGIEVTFEAIDCEERLPRNIELALFRVVQESISNSVRHSKARNITVRFARDPQEIRVEVQDDGHGLPEVTRFNRDVHSKHAGVGMGAMQERIELVGGNLMVESDAEGVTVLAAVPLLKGVNHE